MRSRNEGIPARLYSIGGSPLINPDCRTYAAKCEIEHVGHSVPTAPSQPIGYSSSHPNTLTPTRFVSPGA
jgi:hypothetical protein